jgi:hypothetical protein
MDDIGIRRLTGLAAITAAVLGTTLVPLYFVSSGAPPAWNVLTRSLVNLVAAAAVYVFIAGLACLIRRAGVRYEWLASLVFGACLMYVTVTLVAISLEAGVVLDNPDGTVDPTVDGPVAHANMLLHGSVPRLLTAVMLIAAGYAILQSGVLPLGRSQRIRPRRHQSGIRPVTVLRRRRGAVLQRGGLGHRRDHRGPPAVLGAGRRHCGAPAGRGEPAGRSAHRAAPDWTPDPSLSAPSWTTAGRRRPGRAPGEFRSKTHLWRLPSVGQVPEDEGSTGGADARVARSVRVIRRRGVAAIGGCRGDPARPMSPRRRAGRRSIADRRQRRVPASRTPTAAPPPRGGPGG